MPIFEADVPAVWAYNSSVSRMPTSYLAADGSPYCLVWLTYVAAKPASSSSLERIVVEQPSMMYRLRIKLLCRAQSVGFGVTWPFRRGILVKVDGLVAVQAEGRRYVMNSR